MNGTDERFCILQGLADPRFLSLILFAFALTGCVSFGPSTVSRDRFDYVSTISDSWKSQMLLNIVKLRYADTPAFLDVGSVISQYEFTGEFNATLGFGLPQ